MLKDSRALFYAPFSGWWKAVAVRLRDEGGLRPAVWVGEEDIEFDLAGCYHCDTWESFRLLQRDVWDIPETSTRFHLELFEQMSRREYFTYLKILDRVDLFGAFSFMERDRWFKSQIKYWVQVISHVKIRVVIFNNAPHLPDSYPIYVVAKYLGVKTLFLNMTPFKGVCYLSDSIHSTGDLKCTQVDKSSESRRIYQSLVSQALPKNKRANFHEPYYMTAQARYNKRIVSKLACLPVSGELIYLYRAGRRIIGEGRLSLMPSDKYSSYKEPGTPYWRRSGQNIFSEARTRRKTVRFLRRLRREYDSCAIPYEDDGRPFVYMALHYQPEETSMPRGGLFGDQVQIVDYLAAALPRGWKVIVKEHPSQFGLRLHGYQGRYAGFYEELNIIPNVELVPLDTESSILTERCAVVATISGTVGWEGLVLGKPCLLFGRAWYSTCSGVLNVESVEDCEESLRLIREGKVRVGIEEFVKRFSNAAFLMDETAKNARQKVVTEILSRLATSPV